MTYSEAWAKLAFRCRKQSGRSATTSGKSSSRTEKGTRLNRIPFHKRQPQDYIPSNNGTAISNSSATVSASSSCSSSVNTTQTTSGAAAYTSPGTPQSSQTTATNTNKSVAVAPTSAGSQRFVLTPKRTKQLLFLTELDYFYFCLKKIHPLVDRLPFFINTFLITERLTKHFVNIFPPPPIYKTGHLWSF